MLCLLLRGFRLGILVFDRDYLTAGSVHLDFLDPFSPGNSEVERVDQLAAFYLELG